MVMSDFDRFSKMMLATAEAMDKDLTPQRILVYFDDLKNQDIRALEWAAQAHRRASNFFPKVAELKHLAQAWRPPVHQLGKGQEVKLLESAEDREAKKQRDILRLRGIVAGLTNLDAKYGTNLNKKADFEKRIAELDRQKKVILRGEDIDSGN